MMVMQRIVVSLSLAILPALHGVARADVYVYELLGGSRVVTDHKLNHPDYKLVRHSRSGKGVGSLAASGRRVDQAFADPDAYDRLITSAASAHKVDRALVKAVMHVESAFNRFAVSEKGALGLMQLMPDTAERYGVTDVFDPRQNVDGGVRYLKDLQRMFGNDTRLVLAAYNAGENAVKRHNGIPPYDETQDYVRKVLAVQKAYVPKRVAPARVQAAALKPPVRQSPTAAATTASATLDDKL